MVIDCFTYNGEREMLDIRLNVLEKHVDRFIIVEAKTTFSGNKKPLYFSLHEKYFEQWWSKIDYFIIDENYSAEEIALAQSSPNTKGARHWKNEFLQKESIHKALRKNNVQDGDTVYIGDVDEIWSPSYKPELPVEKILLRVYAYYLNNLSNEVFWGPIVGKYKHLKGTVLNHLRSDVSIRGTDYGGWHFTSMGGLKEVRRKLNDSYTPESYNTTKVQELLPKRLENVQDYLGRDFTFEIDSYGWPKYLKRYSIKYKHLCISPK